MGPYGLFLMSGLAVGALYALGGIGLVLLNRAAGVLNFAYGAIGALGAMTAWQLLQWGVAEPLAWLASIVIGITLSMGFGLVVAPGLSGREPVIKAAATLGFGIALLGLMNVVWVVTPRKLTLSSDQIAVTLLGMRVTLTRLLAFSSAVLALVAIGLFLARTRTGLMMRALADNREVASVLGVPIGRVEATAWGLSGALAGFTGLIFGALVRLDPAVLTFMVIPIIATTIIGRVQSVPATFLGGLALGVIESLLTLYKPLAPFRIAAPFIVSIIALMWLQRGRRLTFSGED